MNLLCLNATSSNSSAISWRPVLVVEEAEVPGESAGSRTSKEEFEDTKGVMIREAYNAMTK